MSSKVDHMITFTFCSSWEYRYLINGPSLLRQSVEEALCSMPAYNVHLMLTTTFWPRFGCKYRNLYRDKPRSAEVTQFSLSQRVRSHGDLHYQLQYKPRSSQCITLKVWETTWQWSLPRRVTQGQICLSRRRDTLFLAEQKQREREHKCPLTDENYPTTVFLLSFKQAKTTQLALCVCLLKTGYLLQEFTSGLK